MSSRSSVPALILAAALALSATPWVAHTQDDLNFSVSPSPVGSGARAAGMADAFVAVADDATAASWNPAGLVQLERAELSLVGQFNRVEDDFLSDPNPEFESKHTIDSYDLNFLSLVYPLQRTVWGRNVTFGLSYQQKYLFDREFSTNLVTDLGGGSTIGQSLDFEQKGQVGAIAASAAFDITPNLALGLSFNFWRSSLLGENGWEQRELSVSDIQFPAFSRVDRQWNDVEYEDIEAENVVVGLMWDVTQRFKLALRYDSGFEADADYSRRTRLRSTDPVAVPNADSFRSEDRQVRFPSTLAAGFAFRPNDNLTLSLDLSTTDWDDFYVTPENGKRFSLVDSHNADDVQVNFDRTFTVRFGVEYVFVPEQRAETLSALWTLRGGLFFDQEPASDRDRNALDSPGSGKPDDFYGAAIGAGVQLGERFNLDWAYQIRYGEDVNTDFFRGVREFQEDFVQHRVLVSTVIYF